MAAVGGGGGGGNPGLEPSSDMDRMLLGRTKDIKELQVGTLGVLSGYTVWELQKHW